MSDAYAGTTGRADQVEWWQSLSYAIVGVAILSTLFAVTNIFQFVTLSTDVSGVAFPTMYGLGLVFVGLGTVALGVFARVGLVETNANARTGVVNGSLAGTLTFVVVALVVSTTLGLGTFVWGPAALILGLAVFLGVTLAREDLGATLPWGVFAAFVGAVFLTGAITPEWQWGPEGFGFAFTGLITIPMLTVVAGLLVAWAGMKATQGFGSRGRQAGAYLLIGVNAFFMLGLLLALILFITEKGAPHALKGAHFGPGLSVHVPFVTNGQGLGFDIQGIFPAVMGTFWLVFGAVLFSVPLGVGAAVFLSEYAERGRFTAVVDVATDGLWSTPSIVYGLFGYAFLLPRLSEQGTPNVLAGMLVLGFMLIPLVLITSREAIQSVPDPYRDASAALGVTRWQTIRSVVLPAALPGIITGVILGVGRIAGETAPILLVATGGLNGEAIHVLDSFQLTTSPPFVVNDALFSATNALPYQIYAVLEAGVGGNVGSGVGNNAAFGWATAFVLLVLVLCFYAVGIATRLYFQDKLDQ